MQDRMSLREYKKKRDFQKTAEPGPEEAHSETGNLFVVQKHDASRLHYDFRLEMGGVLKSWAVPKGFSTVKGERRLAVQVEDHPLDYAKFEGIIPQGEYGGGTVMVWDFGTYETEENPEEALKHGKLRCQLRGQKLQGEWTLVHASHAGEETTWFLIKTHEEGRKISRQAEEHSALSRRTMGQIASQQAEIWHSNRTTQKQTPTAKPGPAPARPARAKARGAKPHWVEPMKATLLKEPPPGEDWIYELKWDGYRALAIKDGDQVELQSRNHKPLTADFPEVRDAIAALPVERAILDGEICALDAEGRPSFQLLQARELGQARPPLFFYAFDLLHLEGQSLMSRPLLERKDALQSLLADPPEVLRYSAPIEGAVEDLLAAVRERGMEGLIAKRPESLYQPGVRSKEWVKLKVSAEQEFVIGGFSPPKGTRSYLGAVLVGYYAGRTLHFAGKVGTGFSEVLLKKMHGLIQERLLEECPFADFAAKSTGGRWSMTAAEARQCRWVRPDLVCQVRFAEWTDQGLLRQPVFLGLRTDKAPREVKREIAR